MKYLCIQFLTFVGIFVFASIVNADSVKNTVKVDSCIVTNPNGIPEFDCLNTCKEKLTIGSAAGGTYGVMAEIISGIARATGTVSGTDCAVIEVDSGSSGSQENCLKVRNKPAYELGIVQSDVFFEMCYPGSENKFVVLHELHDEYIHILARSNLKDIYGLRGKKVSIGLEDSGTIFTARNVLKAHNIDVEERQYSTANALNRMLADSAENQIDAMIYVGGIAGSIFENRKEDLKNVHLLSLDVKAPGLFEDASFTPQQYDWIGKTGIRTWKQKALLITYNWDLIGESREKTCKLVRRLSNMVDVHSHSINDLFTTDLFGGPFEPRSPYSNVIARLECP